jgi:hypothetical protein
MSETPGAPTLEEREERLAEVQKKLEAQYEEMQKDKADMASLQGTLTTIADRISAPAPEPAPAPAPEPPLPTDEEFEANSVAASAQVAGRVMKAGLTQYHNVVGSEIEQLKKGQMEWEKEKIRNSDPDSYDFIKKEIDEECEKYNYTPGLVERVFNLKRGEKFNELTKMKADKAAASQTLSEPVAEPSVGGKPRGKPEPKEDVLTQNQINACRGLGVNPREYFLSKTGRKPEFADGYLASVGLPDKEVGSDVG